MKMILRHIMRYKAYSLLNISGLAIGMACAMLIILWVNNEMSVDRFHNRVNDIYMIKAQFKFINGEAEIGDATPGVLGPNISTQVPEIESSVRLSWVSTTLFRLGDKSFFERGYYADSAFFSMFSYKLIHGDRKTLLDNPNSIAISLKLANKYFKNENPIGKTFYIRDDIYEELFTVTGVFEDVINSSYKFDFIIPFSKRLQYHKEWYHWDSYNLMTFVKKKPGTNIHIINKKIGNILSNNNAWAKKNVTLFSQPFGDNYLFNRFEKSMYKPTGRIVYVRIFSIVAIFIIFLACMNYTNLATALAIKRAKEVGVKKAFGSGKTKLILQYALEAVILTFIAFFIALIIIECVLPFFNTLINKEIRLEYSNLKIILWFMLIPIFTGILAGVFPAYYLSSFNPVIVLKSTIHPRKRKLQLRQTLVMLQFTITICFIISSFVILNQLEYIQNKALGLDKDNVIMFTQGKNIKKQRDSFKEELKKQPGVINVCYTDDNPLNIGSNTTGPAWRGKNPNDEFNFSYMNVDQDFIETFNAEIITGRPFSKLYALDTNSLIINQEAVKIMKFENPIGELVNYWGRKATIIGVVKDFHIGNLHLPIRQMMLICRPGNTEIVMIKIQGNMRKEALKNIEKVYSGYESDSPFNYKFLDEEYFNEYDNEKYMSRFSNLFAILAIIISCLGLFGLALFTAEQKTKEIGIRKSIGANSLQINVLLARDFLKLIAISYAIACILSYFLLNDWLQDFAYRTELSLWIFIITGLITATITLITVSWQSWRAASKNPVESLRYE